MINPKQIEFLNKVFVRRPYFEASAYKVDKLRDVLNTNAFKNAIWLASPGFYRELEKKGFEFDLLNKKERLTALKFYNRMSFRATPFGAFSAFGLGDWNSAGSRQNAAAEAPVLHLMPSVQYELEQLDAEPLTGDVLIAVNPTLYRLHAGWRYSRYETEGKGKLSFFVYLLAYDEADELLLARLDEKPLPFAELIQYLIELTDCTEEEAMAHIARLVDEQVLITAHALSLLSDGAFEDHVSVEYNEYLHLPGFVSRKAAGLANDRDGKSFYAGLELQGSVHLPVHWQEDIMEALKVLDVMAPVPPKNNLDKFREAFEQKFGERRVPLLEALDPDLGVPFDDEQHVDEHELLKGLEFGQTLKKNDQVTWSPVHQLLMKVWLQNNKRGYWEPVVLMPEDLSGLPRNTLPFPPSSSVICSLHGDRVVFQNIGGSTANALTGRFSAFSDEFEVFCRQTATLECDANPNILFAEIEQISHRKIDNINRRRQVYDHVIPLNTFPAENALLPRDIDLWVRDGEIVLAHRPTGKRIIPRLPTAFNYHHNEMPLFRFLCALQYKSIRANFDFDPEKIFPGLNFYPRIEYGRCVISLARWYLKVSEIETLIQRPLSISRLHLFCRERGISSMISVGRGDQQLFFDLGNDDEAIFFLETLAEQPDAVLTESLVKFSKPGNSVDRFNSQFVLSLRNLQPSFVPLTLSPQPQSVIREFQPGSEWIYIKIYATYQSIGHVLSEVILPWIKENQNQIKLWFFVRYHDTGSHLRLRLRADLTAVKDLQFELQSLLNPVHRSGLVQKVYFDTYQREVERYHGELIEDVEHVFFKGSEVVAARLTSNEIQNHDDPIWPIVHCYRIISTFFESGYDYIDQLSSWAALAFIKEQGAYKDLKRSMDERYREVRPALLEAIENDQGHDFDQFGTAIKLLYEKAEFLSDLGRQKLIADIVHMQINRIFISDQRKFETYIWHCLSKLVVTIMKKQIPFELSSISDP